ncbi:MAG: hypothetical protein OH319_00615 [Candidatus Parvarchaeota archaeon]|nr:hypothetical protein [Candidatus Jingweiarchaeum tengchongense]MCW1298354.1 hypothetical protein [Candidatus Jingweiarchaeum tengchongense]MCW1300344.1 hypothetical protein [Candidatus Jingweiarchaeum tengchongense]MCW1304859.1 hypothetical protein [Candidatus Jingweiarchaeum tengchongense]MCW1305840.1 hypothetical protein [Candidatus Jingweiarchaeum tengchongense]
MPKVLSRQMSTMELLLLFLLVVVGLCGFLLFSIAMQISYTPWQMINAVMSWINAMIFIIAIIVIERKL